ncbi:MAG TPA: phosphatidylglycerol lysyltransferase domain-containing protein [Candidatus Saccharimonadales bacterium]
MIPQFPRFSKLAIVYMEEIKNFTSRFEPYSDFNFTSLLSWDTDDSTEVSMLNGNLVVRFTNYTTDNLLYSVIGDNMIDESLLELLAITTSIELVPEIVIKNINNFDLFDVEEDRGAFDYVYILEDLASMNGKKYKTRRNKLSLVTRDIGSNLRSVIITNVNKDMFLSLNKVSTSWQQNSQQNAVDTDRENAAINRILSWSNSLNLFILIFYKDEDIVGFSINEKISDEYSICHFEKALPVHDNIYTYIVHESAKELLTLGSKYINWEQDLNLPGLRKSKLSYQPEKFLKKYQVKLISGTM